MLGISELLDGIGIDTDFLLICPTVILPLKFNDLRASGVGSGKPEGKEIRLCAGVLKADHLGAGDDFDKPAAEGKQIFARRGKVCSLVNLFFHSGIQGIGTIAEDHGAKPVDVINIFISIDIIQTCALAVREGNRIGFIRCLMKGASDSVQKTFFKRSEQCFRSLGFKFFHKVTIPFR